MFLCTTCNQPTSSCSCNTAKTDNIKYTGPDLPCTGIETNDDITLVIQKLNDTFCGLIPPTTTTSSTTGGSTGFNTSGGSATSAGACGIDSYLSPVIYSLSPVMASGAILYSDAARTILFNGGNFWYREFITKNAFQVNTVGLVTATFVCPPTTTTTSSSSTSTTTSTTTNLNISVFRVNNSCCTPPDATERYVDMATLPLFGPTATFTGTDGRGYTLMNSTPIMGAPNVFQHPTDTAIAASCSEWTAVHLQCPTTTTTTTCVGASYQYGVSVLSCDTCANLGGNTILNANKLTIGRYYRDPANNLVYRIATFQGCSASAPNANILNVNQKNICSQAGCNETGVLAFNMTDAAETLNQVCALNDYTVTKVYVLFGEVDFGARLYLDEELTMILDGGSFWRKLEINNTAYRINSDGDIIDKFDCSPTTTTTTTEPEETTTTTTTEI